VIWLTTLGQLEQPVALRDLTVASPALSFSRHVLSPCSSVSFASASATSPKPSTVSVLDEPVLARDLAEAHRALTRRALPTFWSSSCASCARLGVVAEQLRERLLARRELGRHSRRQARP
jgi:hypothetical protein